MRTRWLAAMAMLVAGGSAGQVATASERSGFAAIAAGDLSAAERMLLAERRIFPDRPELMLNLAAVYARTGRADLARALYQQVRARPAATMDMPGGTVASSHAVAARGLGQLAPMIASR